VGDGYDGEGGDDVNKANDTGISTWQIFIAVMTVVVAVAVMAVQWQSTAGRVTSLTAQLNEQAELHDKDIARLDESNRSRRLEIGEINSRLATLEERTG